MGLVDLNDRCALRQWTPAYLTLGSVVSTVIQMLSPDTTAIDLGWDALLFAELDHWSRAVQRMAQRLYAAFGGVGPAARHRALDLAEAAIPLPDGSFVVRDEDIRVVAPPVPMQRRDEALDVVESPQISRSRKSCTVIRRWFFATPARPPSPIRPRGAPAARAWARLMSYILDPFFCMVIVFHRTRDGPGPQRPALML